MTDEERRVVERLLEREAIDTLEVVSGWLTRHASAQRSEPHRTAWVRIAQETHKYWLELASLPGGRR